MGAYGVSVEKTVGFRGAAELTSNTYHYRITAPVAADYEALADAVVARDRLAHPGAFTYKTVRVWGPTDGTKADNLMRLVKDISGAGTRSPSGPAAYPELTACVQIYVGRSPIKNRKVFVRKFIHLSSFQDSGSSGSSGLISATEQGFWQTWFNGCRQVVNGGITFDMVTPRDVLVPSNGPICLPYARIRQLRQ